MKKFILFNIIFLCSVLQLYSQVSQQWSQTYNNTQLPFGSNYSASIAYDNSGNVYTAGKSDSMPTTSDFLLIKTNSAGVRQWIRRYNGPFNGSDEAISVKTDASGNIYLSGMSQSSDTSYDYATVKFNSSGVQQWASRYAGLDQSYFTINDFEIDNSGNTYVAGAIYRSISTNFDFIVVKYNSSGAQQWVSFYDSGNDDYLPRLKIASSGNVYIAGASATVSEMENFRIVKLNSSGAFQWTKTYNGTFSDNDTPVGIETDASENVFVLGSANGYSQSDFVTLKYNSAGTIQWTKIYHDSVEFASDITVDKSGNPIITGYRYYNGIPYSRIVTIKYNSAGTQLWLNTIANGNGDIPSKVKTDTSGNVYLLTETTDSSQNIVTVKYNSSGVQQWSIGYTYNAASSDAPIDFSIDNSGNIFVTGNTFNFITLTSMISIFKYVQTNNQSTLNLTAFVEGFYNSNSNTMIPDTAKAIIRNLNSPYNKIDSSKAVISNSGSASFNFSNVSNGINYYLVLKHRNSIETWSSSGVLFTSNSMTYNFSNSSAQAFGNNEKQIDSSPLRFGIYSGDVNQDGSVDLTDNSLIDNDAYNFVSGYVVADLNGDNFVDIIDGAIADNNGYNFVSIARP